MVCRIDAKPGHLSSVSQGGKGIAMLGTVRKMRLHLVERMSGSWCPPADEAWISFRPLPWEIDGDGKLRRAALENIAGLAARNWLATAGPGRACAQGRMIHAIDGDVDTPFPARTMATLTATTRLRGRDSRSWILSHRIEYPSGRAVAIMNSRLAVSSQAEWSVFPPYPVAGEAGAAQ
jgi:hypothetical protein